MIESESGDVDFHHIGVACDSLEAGLTEYARVGYALEGALFVDPLQGVRGCFVVGPGPRLELLEPLPDSSVLRPWLASPARMYHLGFLTSDIEHVVERSLERRARVMRPPLPAPAFGGRHVTFVMFPGRILIEYIERAA